MAYTTHYHFTLFESTDKPTWLEDWNTTIAAIDTALYNISSGGGELPDLTEVVARLQALEGRVDSDELRLNQIEGYIDTMQDDIVAVQNSITSLTEGLSGANAQVASLATDLGTLSDSVDSLSATLSSLSTRMATAESSIESLGLRITALEQSSGGNAMTGHFTDLGTLSSTPQTFSRQGSGVLHLAAPGGNGSYLITLEIDGQTIGSDMTGPYSTRPNPNGLMPFTYNDLGDNESRHFIFEYGSSINLSIRGYSSSHAFVMHYY